MKTKNKASRAVRWGLIGLLGLGLGNIGCGPKGMSFEKSIEAALENKWIIYQKNGEVSFEMLALERFAEDFGSEDVGTLYTHFSDINKEEKLKSIIKDKGGIYQMKFIKPDGTEGQTISYKSELYFELKRKKDIK